MRDDVDEALQELVVALRHNIDRLERAIGRADHLRAERATGKPWSEIVAAEDRPIILELIGQNLEELYQVGGRLRRAEARALHHEGLSMEQVARLFGVTRQRISALLKNREAAEAVPLPGD